MIVTKDEVSPQEVSPSCSLTQLRQKSHQLIPSCVPLALMKSGQQPFTQQLDTYSCCAQAFVTSIPIPGSAEDWEHPTVMSPFIKDLSQQLASEPSQEKEHRSAPFLALDTLPNAFPPAAQPCLNPS